MQWFIGEIQLKKWFDELQGEKSSMLYSAERMVSAVSSVKWEK